MLVCSAGRNAAAALSDAGDGVPEDVQLDYFLACIAALPASMAVPEPNDVRFRRDLQRLLLQFAERSRAAAQNEPGRRSAPLGDDEEPAQHLGGFAHPVSQRPGVAGVSPAMVEALVRLGIRFMIPFLLNEQACAGCNAMAFPSPTNEVP